jgi:hypothetical protein
VDVRLDRAQWLANRSAASGLSEFLRHDTDESRLFGNRWLPAGSSGDFLLTARPSEKATARQDETRRLADRVLAKSKRKGRLGLIQPPGEGCTSFLIRGLSNFRARRFLPASLQIRNANAGTLRASNRTIGMNRLFIAALTVGVATEDAQLADSK